jgi:membrane fusion protein
VAGTHCHQFGQKPEFQMNETVFRKEALAHQQDRLKGEVIISQPLSYQALTLLLALSAAFALLYLVANDYTRRVNVSGFLVPTKGVVAVFAPQPGLLRELYVADGENVKQGTALFTMQTDRKTATGNYLTQDILQQLKHEKARLIDAIDLEKKSLTVILEQQEIAAKQIADNIASLDVQIVTQQALQKIEHNSYTRAQDLRSRGSLSPADLDTAEKNYLAVQLRLADLQANRSSKKFDLAENTTARLGYVINNRQEIAEIENRVSELNRQISITESEQSNIVRAPASGTVTSLLANPGQQLDPSVPALTLIPDDSVLEAHLYIPTRAIGFVAQTQVVKLRYDAFPYQRFGFFTGHITQVTNAVLGSREIPEVLPIKEPVYRVTVALARQAIEAYGAEVRLKPGMLLSADIELDKRSLLEWLLEPLYSLRGKL